VNHRPCFCTHHSQSICAAVTKQGRDHDPDGLFIRKYVPELRTVPKQYIHEPWKMPKLVAQSCSSDWKAYPRPIVDEKQSAKDAKEKVGRIKRSEAAKKEAKKVYEKHGSRRGSTQRKRKRGGNDESAKSSGIVKFIKRNNSWTCATCTFVNTKPEAPVCEVCRSCRNKKLEI